MSIGERTKINQLLTSLPAGVVVQSFWLKEKGYSPSLQQRYREGNWLEPIAKGAMIRAGDNVDYEGAIYALQKQSKMSVHPGGKTALSFLGKSHYLTFSQRINVIVFGDASETLPAWVSGHDWGVEIDYYRSTFLPPDLGITEIRVKNFSIKVSGAARAFMECLYLAPEKMELMECYEIMEGLNNLKPDQVGELLEKCQSVKVKRLFLYMAEKANHSWFKYLNLIKVDLGKGKRSIVKNGVYIDKFRITVPKELAEYGK